MILTAHKSRILDNPAGTPNKLRRAGEAKRIEMLGVLNDRHNQALTAGDKQALIEIASEYAMIGCGQMANKIIAESENL